MIFKRRYVFCTQRRLTASFDPDLTLEDVGAKLSRHNDDAAANEDFMLVVHPGKSMFAICV